MATPTSPNGETQFFVSKYVGNGAGQRVGKFVPFTDSGTIANSVIFNDGDSAYLDRTFGSGNQKIWTMSFWVKRCTLGTGQRIISRRTGGGSTTATMGFLSSNTFDFYDPSNGSQYITNRTFEDTSKFYHFLIRYEASNATAADRLQIYVDGDLQTFGTTGSISDANGNFNAAVTHAIGKYQYNNSEYLDAYLAEVNWIDGTNYGPETFGVTDPLTGRWIPKTLSGITYGTNGFRLKFQDSSALGNDTSGNTNDLASTNLSASDQTTDSPTQNHATIDSGSASNTSMSFSEGNLKVSMNNAYPGNVLGTLGASSGKYYWEVTISGTGSSANGYATGIGAPEWSGLNSDAGGVSTPFSTFIDSRGSFLHNGTSTSNSTTFTAGDVISIALNLDDSEISYFKNNTIVGSAQPLVEGQTYFPFFKNSTTVADLRYTPNFGQKSWNYTPPTGFVALQQDNLPETAKGISGLVWTKNRDATDNHQLYDSSRGKQLSLASNTTSGEATVTDGLQKFLAGGQQIEDDVSINTAGESFVSWNWTANGGSTSSNTDGSITSTVQANTTAGFSIVQYTGNGSVSTVGHGLSSAPEWVLVKARSTDTGDGFSVQHVSTGTDFYDLSKTNARNSNTVVWNSVPTSTVFSIGTATGTNTNSATYLAYCWHSVDGFSKFGSYTGNGSTDGPFIYTGFKPRFLIVKSTATGNWNMFDSARNTFNPVKLQLYTDTTEVDYDLGARGSDFLSNGFKLRQETGYGSNNSGQDYIYMAFAKHPFVGDGTSPVTAR